jgi:voltage-gated potassium channel
MAPIVAFGTTVAVGVAGFVALTGIGVVDALFWILDPTSIELHFESHGGPERLTKAFGIVVFGSLVLSGLWVGESVLDTVFGNQFQEELRQVRIQQSIDGLSDHVVICGYGMFGRTVAQQLEATDRDVVVVESDQTVFDRVGDDMLAVRGDARQEDVLTEAGVERAAAVIAGIDDSNVNIQIAILTSQLSPNARLVVRVGEEMYESLARRAGADTVVIPEKVSGDEVVDGL